MNCCPTHTAKVFASHSFPKALNASFKHKYILAVDIDETLLHSTKTYESNTDLIINCLKGSIPTTLYVFIRPYAREFLIYMSQFYDVYFYTASSQNVSYWPSTLVTYLIYWIHINWPKESTQEISVLKLSMELSRISLISQRT